MNDSYYHVSSIFIDDNEHCSYESTSIGQVDPAGHSWPFPGETCWISMGKI